jgi:hypothetical protein
LQISELGMDMKIAVTDSHKSLSTIGYSQP